MASTRTRELNWVSYRFIEQDGYGRFGLNFIRALHRIGVRVYPSTVEQIVWPVWLQHLAGADWSRLTIALMPSYELMPLSGRVWNYTMYEGTGLEPRWVPALNERAERLLVPHEFLVDVFRDHGARLPIHVVPGGTDPTEFPVSVASPYESGRPYTFLALGDRGSRKGWDIAWQAFWEAFGEHTEDVRLVVKMRPNSLPRLDLSRSDRRVSLWREDADSMLSVYEQCDCFVFPTRGEGWGMPPREFAMTGKPVICTRWSGVEDGIDHWALPVAINGLVPSVLPGGGMWASPRVDEVASWMRWCYDHPDDARRRGLAAARWLRENQTWDHAATKLWNLVEEVCG